MRQDKMWLFSGRILPILLLVVMPFALPITLASLYFYGYGAHVLGLIFTYPTGGVGFAVSKIYLISIVTLVFGFYPIKFNIIKRKGFANLIIEYRYVKRILCVEIPILIFVTSMVVSLLYNNYRFTPITLSNFIYLQILSPLGLIANPLRLGESFILMFNGLMINLGFSITAGIIYMVLLRAKKDTRYYMAKTCFEAISKMRDQTAKVNYLIAGIKFYDRYLQRTLNVQINDVKKIYSKIISDSNIDKNEAMCSILASFESHEDKLKPVKCISKMLNAQKTEEFLVDVSLGHRLKDMAIFFATIIPVAIGIIQLLLHKGNS